MNRWYGKCLGGMEGGMDEGMRECMYGMNREGERESVESFVFVSGIWGFGSGSGFGFGFVLLGWEGQCIPFHLGF